MRPQGWVCGPRVYKYKGWLFEVHGSGGPWPLRKDGEPRKRAGDVFWDLYSEFNQLPEDEKKAHRIGGGCIAF